MIGRVTSTKMPETAVVLVESKKTHPLYGKSYVWTKKYLVDDQFGVKNGDIVVFVKTRPISRHKHWQITKVLGQDFVSLEQAELQEEAAEAIAEVLPEEKEKEAEEIRQTSNKKEKSEEIKTEKIKKTRVKKTKEEK